MPNVTLSYCHQLMGTIMRKSYIPLELGTLVLQWPCERVFTITRFTCSVLLCYYYFYVCTNTMINSNPGQNGWMEDPYMTRSGWALLPQLLLACSLKTQTSSLRTCVLCMSALFGREHSSSGEAAVLNSQPPLLDLDLDPHRLSIKLLLLCKIYTYSVFYHSYVAFHASSLVGARCLLAVQKWITEKFLHNQFSGQFMSG